MTSGGGNKFLSETVDFSCVPKKSIFFKPNHLIKAAISEFGILDFKKFHLGVLLQNQLKYVLLGPN